MARSKDLFDDSTMSFGEHLEVLRVHLWKALIGLVLCVIVALFFGDRVVAIVRAPIDDALEDYGIGEDQVVDDAGSFDLWTAVRKFFTGNAGSSEKRETPEEAKARELDDGTILVELDAEELNRALKAAAPPPDSSAADGADDVSADGDDQARAPDGKRTVQIALASEWFVKLERVAKRQNQAVTLTVQEAFMTYLKVAIVAGLVVSSPWVIYQLWQFVAAGLYPHERKYVYIYLPMSIGLFLGGAVFCFYMVFPFVLSFLLGFNRMLEVQPQIRLSEWISFAIILPVMFGLSFQLPVVMLFLERISIFQVADYRSKRRMAILVIAIVSMFMTPADPASMLMMMLPLVALYELGIWFCQFRPSGQRPFEEPEAV